MPKKDDPKHVAEKKIRNLSIAVLGGLGISFAASSLAAPKTAAYKTTDYSEITISEAAEF